MALPIPGDCNMRPVSAEQLQQQPSEYLSKQKSFLRECLILENFETSIFQNTIDIFIFHFRNTLLHLSGEEILISLICLHLASKMTHENYKSLISALIPLAHQIFDSNYRSSMQSICSEIDWLRKLQTYLQQERKMVSRIEYLLELLDKMSPDCSFHHSISDDPMHPDKFPFPLIDPLHQWHAIGYWLFQLIPFDDACYQESMERALIACANEENYQVWEIAQVGYGLSYFLTFFGTGRIESASISTTALPSLQQRNQSTWFQNPLSHQFLTTLVPGVIELDKGVSLIKEVLYQSLDRASKDRHFKLFHRRSTGWISLLNSASQITAFRNILERQDLPFQAIPRILTHLFNARKIDSAQRIHISCSCWNQLLKTPIELAQLSQFLKSIITLVLDNEKNKAEIRENQLLLLYKFFPNLSGAKWYLKTSPYEEPQSPRDKKSSPRLEEQVASIMEAVTHLRALCLDVLKDSFEIQKILVNGDRNLQPFLTEHAQKLLAIVTQVIHVLETPSIESSDSPRKIIEKRAKRKQVVKTPVEELNKLIDDLQIEGKALSEKN